MVEQRPLEDPDEAEGGGGGGRDVGGGRDEGGEEVRRVQGVKQKVLLKRSVEEQKQKNGDLGENPCCLCAKLKEARMKRTKGEQVAKR